MTNAKAAQRVLGAAFLTLGLLGAGISPAQAEPVCERNRDSLPIVSVGVDYCTDGTTVPSLGVFAGIEDGLRVAVQYHSGYNSSGENFTRVCVYHYQDKLDDGYCVEVPVS